MKLKFDLIVEKTENNKFNASIGFVSTKVKGCTSLSLLQDDPLKAINDAIQPILIIAPNFTQEEIDNHYAKHGYP